MRQGVQGMSCGCCRVWCGVVRCKHTVAGVVIVLL